MYVMLVVSVSTIVNVKKRANDIPLAISVHPSRSTALACIYACAKVLICQSLDVLSSVISMALESAV